MAEPASRYDLGVRRTDRPIAVVLPHREVFQRDGAGAVSLFVRDAAAASHYRPRTVVFGEPVAASLDPECFVPVSRASWIHGRRASRYLKGVIKALAKAPPVLIEIHNRPVYIPALRAAFPHTPLLLYIHNDPRTMRGLREVRQRVRAVDDLAAVVCVSHYVRRCMLEGLEDHPRRDNVHVVLNGVDTSRLRPAADELKRREIVFVGRLSPQKGGLLFAKAAAALRDRLPGWRFVLIGARRFSRGLDSDYERRVAAHMTDLNNQGELTGYLPRDEVFRRLSYAAIAVVPSTWEEPFCLAAVEAMSAGCAVVASRRGGLTEVVDDAGLLFSPDDERELTEHIYALASEPGTLRRYQRWARARAESVLDIRRCIGQLDGLRSDILQEGE